MTTLLQKYLEWDADTCREKIIPLLIEWDATHRYDKNIGCFNSILSLCRTLFAEFVVTEIASIGTKGRQAGNQVSEVVVHLKRRDEINEQYEAFDRKWLTEKASDGKWHLRKTLVDDHYADLVRAFKNTKGKKRGKAQIEDECRKITDFFKDIAKAKKAPAPSSPVKQVRALEALEVSLIHSLC